MKASIAAPLGGSLSGGRGGPTPTQRAAALAGLAPAIGAASTGTFGTPVTDRATVTSLTGYLSRRVGQ